MILLDVNVLLYAHSELAPEGPGVRAWLGTAESRYGWFGLPWVTAWGFLRIVTNPRISQNALSMEAALAILQKWMARPNVVPVNPGPSHSEILRQIVMDYQVRGPLVTDAVLAARAMEHGATLASSDQGFRRFHRVKWVNPLDDPGVLTM